MNTFFLKRYLIFLYLMPFCLFFFINISGFFFLTWMLNCYGCHTWYFQLLILDVLLMNYCRVTVAWRNSEASEQSIQKEANSISNIFDSCESQWWRLLALEMVELAVPGLLMVSEVHLVQWIGSGERCLRWGWGTRWTMMRTGWVAFNYCLSLFQFFVEVLYQLLQLVEQVWNWMGIRCCDR